MCQGVNTQVIVFISEICSKLVTILDLYKHDIPAAVDHLLSTLNDSPSSSTIIKSMYDFHFRIQIILKI